MSDQAETFSLVQQQQGFTPIPNVPVHAFESLVNELGLVRVKITKDFAPYTPNPEVGWSIAGFDPVKAKLIYDLAAGYPCDEEGKPVSLEGEIQEPPPALDNDLEIPDDWAEGHHLPRIRLAKAIKGSDETMSDAEARSIIQSELDRRYGNAA